MLAQRDRVFCFVPLDITPIPRHCPRSDRLQTLLILLIRRSFLILL